ncbi:MAG TPA: hypothetical protein VHY91_23480 [Pirellulales bacterium]|jgi:hypothetical protein|nr:hypothetical protein [Pirellulales bacterium]
MQRRLEIIAVGEAAHSPGEGCARIEYGRYNSGRDEGKLAYRFSWWADDGKFINRALDLTEEQALELFRDSISNGAFTPSFLGELRLMLDKRAATQV